MSLNVHAGRKNNVDTALLHFVGKSPIYLSERFRRPHRSQQRARRNAGVLFPVLRSRTGRTVAQRDNRNAVRLEKRRRAADDRRRSGNPRLRASPTLSFHELRQFFRRELREEIVYAALPRRDVLQRISLIACNRYRIRQIFGISAIIAGYLRFSVPRQPHKTFLRMQSIARPLDADRFGKDILADFHAIARVFSEQNGICSRLHDKRMTEATDVRIVKGAHGGYGEGYSYSFAFFRRKRFCLIKCSELPLRLSKPPLRRGEIYLYHLFPRAIALIPDRHFYNRILFFKSALR